MESPGNGCSGQTQTTTAAETSLSQQTCHDIQHSTRKISNDDADADQYSDVFTMDDRDMTASQHQQQTAPLMSAEEEEEEEEGAEDMWDAITEDSITICGFSLNNDDDINARNVDDREQMSDLRAHASDVD